MRHPVILCLCLLSALSVLRGGVPPLLQEVADKLTDERQRWAFTQVVREFSGDRVVLERKERFDPSRGDERRWQLLELNGRVPTPREAEAWSDRKNRVRRRPPKAVAEYVDLEQARVVGENATTVSYEVPFRRSAGGLFPGDKVNLTLTINKRAREVERAQVSIDESFKVALGLARIIDIDLDLEMTGRDDAGDPDTADRPRGSASAIVNRLGRRIEYHWSDFTRREPPPATERP